MDNFCGIDSEIKYIANYSRLNSLQTIYVWLIYTYTGNEIYLFSISTLFLLATNLIYIWLIHKLNLLSKRVSYSIHNIMYLQCISQYCRFSLLLVVTSAQDNGKYHYGSLQHNGKHHYGSLSKIFSPACLITLKHISQNYIAVSL